ncbi:hypothetical protein ANCCAN_07167 [Ancylostoma caninum]|uniref:SCP domain-containing protein n=1 Tax=Ancylostoma caninum TaxID=29170 RepID=A0A368GTB5_ANCCA|nr:hypothetical protein ANCCAN_07167 [Ancylostoma caninum]
MGPLPGDGCPEEVRNPLYKKLKEQNSGLKYNCTLEGVSLVTATFKNEREYLSLYENFTAEVQHLWHTEKNTYPRTYGDDKPWKYLNITNFINNATAQWNSKLTNEPVKDKTQVGCYFDVDFNYTLVCSFA